MALRLTRKVNESLMIGDDIIVTVIAVKGRQAKIQIDAPRDVSIMREELYDRGVRRDGDDFVTDER